MNIKPCGCVMGACVRGCDGTAVGSSPEAELLRAYKNNYLEVIKTLIAERDRARFLLNSCEAQVSNLISQRTALEGRLERDDCAYSTSVLWSKQQADQLTQALVRAEQLERCLQDVNRGFDEWPEVYAFAKRMCAALTRHKPKKGGRENWRKYHPGSLLSRVREETDELEEAINLVHPNEEVLSEAIDVANMAMMVADTYAYVPKSPKLSRFGVQVITPTGVQKCPRCGTTTGGGYCDRCWKIYREQLPRCQECGGTEKVPADAEGACVYIPCGSCKDKR